MSYASLEQQIHSLPENCLEEVSNYIDFILFRERMRKQTDRSSDVSSFFGALPDLPDGTELQRSMRDEWD